MTPSGRFTIGELARRTGLPVKTIRFYSDEGLVPPTDRTAAGYRLYDVTALARLELVRTLRELGLALADIERVLGGASTVAELAKAHVAALDDRLRELRHRRAVLRAVANRESELEEVGLMNKLASMSDEERKRLVDEFWDEVTEGLDVDTEFYAWMRSAKPELPDDPSPQQLEAWIEFAELVSDAEFRALIRGMGEQQAQRREAGQDVDAFSWAQKQRWEDWHTRAQDLLDGGVSPQSAEGRALADEIVRASLGEADTSTWFVGAGVPEPVDGPEYRTWLAGQIDAGGDARAERYWQLLAIINGWPPIPSRVAATKWVVAAVRASA
ncbi:DNA-binding transcriptional MerR regulator [Prauserella isguenensis]|uniref:DNA-binding transcriptional MerR regulator n=1 Tax=Prauserella isguenensis TaxID=1470180 RepID=A0A839RYF3_9PSEU|nr:MerR family transcriptional regulator [Prauserella isguenensis]MBB3050192.1 DNA-binding transcriptional MerR regulator [Prauserella isguenensis]